MATINARIDDKTKSQADKVLSQLGISQTQAITAFYQYIASHGKLPLIITQQVTTAEDIYSKICEQFVRAADSFYNLKSMIEDPNFIDGRDAQKEYRQLIDIHVSVWNEMPNIDFKRDFVLLADSLKGAISVLGDFNNFGYGFQIMKVTDEERKEFRDAADYFIHLMAYGAGKDNEENARERYILALDKEIRELDELHNKSMLDSTLTMPQRTAISNEYCIKSKMLEGLAFNSLTTSPSDAFKG